MTRNTERVRYNVAGRGQDTDLGGTGNSSFDFLPLTTTVTAEHSRISDAILTNLGLYLFSDVPHILLFYTRKTNCLLIAVRFCKVGPKYGDSVNVKTSKTRAVLATQFFRRAFTNFIITFFHKKCSNYYRFVKKKIGFHVTGGPSWHKCPTPFKSPTMVVRYRPVLPKKQLWLSDVTNDLGN